MTLNKLNITLHRTFGKLFTVQGNMTRAREELAQCIYLESQDYGPESIALSRSYYLMGHAFLSERKYEEAMAIFNKIRFIWRRFLDEHNEPVESIIIEEGGNIL
mmetsp:Transcript_2381/g.1503  ORF Transcript_2381/g.1503 Transcript_2381/m.1503 type:complete len:104 (-) Transcript_2381:236-547(-)